MDVFESRLGSIFVIVYAIASIVLAAVSFFCKATYCGLFLIVPILPWATLLEGTFNIPIPWAAYPLFLLLNVVIVYSMGVAVEYFWTSRES